MPESMRPYRGIRRGPQGASSGKLVTSEMAHADLEAAEQVLDLLIVQALERAPEVGIPDDFAVRTAAAIPARTLRLRRARVAVRTPVRRAAYVAAMVCLVALAAAMLALAPHSAQRVFYQVLEFVLASQFCMLAAWVAFSRGVSAD